ETGRRSRQGVIYRYSGGSMRIGNRLSGALVWAMVATAAASVSAQAGMAERGQPGPLRGNLSEQEGDRHFGVYVTTTHGGNVTIKTTSGTVSQILGPDGRERQNGQDVGRNQHGWYSFVVTGVTKSYTVETSFVQVGESVRKPWNFYYWPTKSDAVHEPWA